MSEYPVIDRRALPLKCRRKQRLTELEARTIAGRYAATDRMAAYECPYCHGWHVGHVTSQHHVVAADTEPESLDAAVIERRKLGAELQALQSAMARVKADQTQQGWFRSWSNLQRERQVKMERQAFLRAWLAQHGSGANRVLGSSAAEKRREVLTEDGLAYLNAVLARIDDDKDLSKLFRQNFALTVSSLNDDPELPDKLERFRGRLALWAQAREEAANDATN